MARCDGREPPEIPPRDQGGGGRREARVLGALERLLIGGSKTAVILEYAEVIAPAGDPNFQSESDRAAVVTLHQWSFLPEIEKGDNVRCALRETRLVVVERVAGAVLGSGRRRDAL